MKNSLRKTGITRTTGRIFILTAFVIFLSACEQEEMIAPQTQPDAELKAAPAKGSESIAEIAINAGFNELVAALSYVDAELETGLVDLFLNGTDQYTVFAPTDMAFTNLYGALEIGGITDLPAELVLDVLLYHVTGGRRAANSVVPKRMDRTIETLLGESFTVKSDGSIQAIGNTANIAAADISASNGIIHVIDAVILPIQ